MRWSGTGIPPHFSKRSLKRRGSNIAVDVTYPYCSPRARACQVGRLAYLLSIPTSARTTRLALLTATLEPRTLAEPTECPTDATATLSRCPRASHPLPTQDTQASTWRQSRHASIFLGFLGLARHARTNRDNRSKCGATKLRRETRGLTRDTPAAHCRA